MEGTTYESEANCDQHTSVPAHRRHTRNTCESRRKNMQSERTNSDIGMLVPARLLRVGMPPQRRCGCKSGGAPLPRRTRPRLAIACPESATLVRGSSGHCVVVVLQRDCKDIAGLNRGLIFFKKSITMRCAYAQIWVVDFFDVWIANMTLL